VFQYLLLCIQWTLNVGPWLWKQAKIKEEKAKRELRGRHSDCYWVEVSKREEKMERSKKERHWTRRSRMTDQQGRWIVDNSASGKIHYWMLWSTAREGRKDRLAKP
jgi:hypothetical protein